LSDNNVVRENTFKKNKQGIFEEDCEGNVIENNIVEDDF
jgi:parallel beta-helix repeat protein